MPGIEGGRGPPPVGIGGIFGIDGIRAPAGGPAGGIPPPPMPWDIGALGAVVMGGMVCRGANTERPCACR